MADTPAKRQRGISIQLAYRGVLVTFSYAADQSMPVAEMEQSIDTLLTREGWAAPTPATNGAGITPKGKPKADYVEAIYNDDGDPCCPVHNRKLTEGRYGPYCTAKARDGEVANDKGYCNVKFKM